MEHLWSDDPAHSEPRAMKRVLSADHDISSYTPQEVTIENNTMQRESSSLRHKYGEEAFTAD